MSFFIEICYNKGTYKECMRDWLYDYTATCQWQGATSRKMGLFLLAIFSLFIG